MHGQKKEVKSKKKRVKSSESENVVKLPLFNMMTARKRVKIESSTRQYDEYAVTTPNNENATSERNARRKQKRIGDFARKIGC